jgi:chloramphenicol-sensitive protein RarD
VATRRVLQTSLGYFLNPTVSVVLGMVVMGERLRPTQWLAVALSAAGVLQLATLATDLPWIALVLALTFGFYGLVRKTAPIDALPGSTLETALGVPFALAYLGYLWLSGTGHFLGADLATDALLASTGLITAMPLLWFANAARRLPLSTIGFVQYLSPTGQLLLAVLAFGEPFTTLHLRSFACIWAGVAIFTVDSWRQSRRRAAAPGGGGTRSGHIPGRPL